MVDVLVEVEGHHPDMTVHSVHNLGGVMTNHIISSEKIIGIAVDKQLLRKKK